MINQFNDQMKQSLKPWTELATLNMTAMQDIVEKQNALYTKLLNDGAAFAQLANDKDDMNSLVEAQKEYLQNLQETLTESAKETFAIIAKTQEQAGSVMMKAGEEAKSKMPIKMK